MTHLAKLIGAALAGAVGGFTLATVILFPLLQNAEGRGRSQGFSQGAAHVMSFVSRHLKSEPGQKEKLLSDSLKLKRSRLSLVEVNGIKTLRVDAE